MQDFIIIAIVIVIVAIRLRSAIKHPKGQCGYCGGNDDKQARIERAGYIII